MLLLLVLLMLIGLIILESWNLLRWLIYHLWVDRLLFGLRITIHTLFLTYWLAFLMLLSHRYDIIHRHFSNSLWIQIIIRLTHILCIFLGLNLIFKRSISHEAVIHRSLSLMCCVAFLNLLLLKLRSRQLFGQRFWSLSMETIVALMNLSLILSSRRTHLFLAWCKWVRIV